MAPPGYPWVSSYLLIPFCPTIWPATAKKYIYMSAIAGRTAKPNQVIFFYQGTLEYPAGSIGQN